MTSLWHFRIAAALFFFGFTSILFYIIYSDDSSKEKQKQIAEVLKSTPVQNSYFQVPPDWLYPEAPNPDSTLDSFLKSRELWPDIGEKPFDEAHREKIRREWLDFAARYPDNLFIPNEYKNLTPEQKEAIRKNNELAASYAAKQAAQMAQEKYREPGQNPPLRTEPPPNPAEHRAWLNYKIQETKSLIEIIEYFLEKGNPNPEQLAQAKEDLAKLRMELREYEKVLSQVPKE